VVHIDVKVVRQARERAVQVVLADWSIWWLPRSQIQDGFSLRGGERNLTLAVTEWIVEEKEAEAKREEQGDADAQER
jgi:hypothetical protein